MTEPEMKLADFKTLLRNHDWTYQYSDDPGMWRRGCKQHDEIMAAKQGRGPEFQAAYDEERKKYFP